MISLWNPADRQALKARLAGLSPGATARWGQMDAPRMLAHVADALRSATGEVRPAPKRLPLRYPPLKQLVIYWLPFPKGAPTAPELVAREPAGFAAERDAVAALLDRFAALPPGRDWPEHAAFGMLGARAWGVLMARHLDHHLRQFGA